MGFLSFLDPDRERTSATAGWTAAPTLDAVLFQGQFLTQGQYGPAVAQVQQLLGIPADGYFGTGTRSVVESFQRSVQMAPTSDMAGAVGKTTLRTLLAVKRQWLPAPSLDEVRAGLRMLWMGQAGPAVQEFQRLLRQPPNLQDGYFGQSTHDAVAQFQRVSNNPAPQGMEGVVGRTIIEALLRSPGQAGAGGITLQQLRAIMPHLAQDTAAQYLPFLNSAMAERNITTPKREAAFLAQLAHESGELRYWEELSSGAQYEGRKDLGNTQPGDGPRYKGRGPIQLTGRNNYRAAGQALNVDLENNPTLAATPQVGFRVAAWFWDSHGLNALADNGDFVGITRVINGGLNGLQQRQQYYQQALHVLGA